MYNSRIESAAATSSSSKFSKPLDLNWVNDWTAVK